MSNKTSLTKDVVAMATIAKVGCQSILTVPITTMNTRKAAAKSASVAPAAKRALTVVGAPSNASGIHMWKGTTAILTPKPATKRTIAIRAKALESGVIVPRELAIAWRFVEPVTPNVKDIA